MVITGADMDTQVWFGGEPRADLFQDIYLRESSMFNKPLGGFWTSTLIEPDFSDWGRFLVNEDLRPDYLTLPLWRMGIRSDARVFRVANWRDAETLRALYGYRKYNTSSHMLTDWRLVAEKYDAVHLASPYAGGDLFYGWDVESTVYFRWCFTEIERIA